jgi:hypothetical protein
MFTISDHMKQLFEESINLISYDICSPIAKVIAYCQVIKEGIIRNFDELEADEVQDQMLNFILNLNSNHTIENLYIDIKII